MELMEVRRSSGKTKQIMMMHIISQWFMYHNLEIENFTYIFTISEKFTRHLRKREII